MKRREAALALGILISTMTLTACQGNKNAGYEGQTIYGQVSEVTEDSVIIEIGTQKEESPELELTGETEEITIEDDTVLQKQSMGGGMPTGEMPEKPDGEAGEAPEKPDGEAGEMPEKPDGEAGEKPEKPDGEAGEMPEKPDGEAGEMPEKPDGEAGEMPGEEITIEDLAEGDIVSITFDAEGNAEELLVMSMGPMNGTNGVTSYEAVKEYTEDSEVEREKIASTGADENAVHVYKGATVSMEEMVISRISGESTGGDDSSFYGVGAAVLATEGTLNVSDSEITTDANGGAGLFAYGDGTIYAKDTKITTQKDTSGGIHAAGGGTLYAWDMEVDTAGESSAAIRSDRGGGKMVVDGGTYTSNGVGSPAIYSTADIAVKDAELVANGSEAICIEGLNSIHLYDCDLTGNMAENEQNDCVWNVILYQSMSGDSEVGNSTFEMQEGTLTAKNGGMFYTTNTESTITLKDVKIKNASNSEFFLRCTGNQNARGWGSSGANGADCLFTAIDQNMEGDVIWDSISQLDFYMTDESSLQGAIRQDETYAGDGKDGYASLYIEKGSTWTVTDDSTLTNLYCEGKIVDVNGNTVTVKGSDGTIYVKGKSAVTVTVDSFEESVDLSGASKTSAWSVYEEESPF